MRSSFFWSSRCWISSWIFLALPSSSLSSRCVCVCVLHLLGDGVEAHDEVVQRLKQLLWLLYVIKSPASEREGGVVQSIQSTA